MRILTVISGILLAAAGAFTFAFYTNAFTGLAFILGSVMLVSGLCSLGAYIISGRTNRLPDTVLVEGMVCALFGFAVLNNSVSDAMVVLFFGTWMTLAGVTRISQSFAVSRFRPKDWAKIMPLAMMGTILGLIMLMPSLTSEIDPMFLVGGAFIVNGFSQLIYAMYMRKHKLTQREIEAQERAEARKIAKEAERMERDKNRSVSWHEREEKREEERRQEKHRLAEQRAAKMQELQERRASRRPAEEATMEFTPEEVAEIRAAAGAQEQDGTQPEAVSPGSQPEEPFAQDEPIEEIPAEEAPAEETVTTEQAPEPSAEESAAEEPGETPAREEAFPAEEAEEEPAPVEESAVSEEAEAEPEPQLSEEEFLRETREKAKAPVWKAPENIPSLRAAMKAEPAETPAPAAKEPEELVPAKRAAVNIEKIEEGLTSVEFAPIELPQLELASEGGEAEARGEIIQELEKEVKKEDPFKPFQALKLEDLFGDDYVPLREKDPKEATRFTQSLNLDWTKRP